MATYNITLKAWSDNAALEPLTIYQNDVLSRTINITLMDNNGPPIDLTDSAVRVYFVKDDKKIVYQEADIISETNGKISVTCDSQVTAVPGPVVAMVQAIYNNGSTLNIGPLRLIIVANNLDNAIISTNDFSALTAALLKADSIKNKVDSVILEGNQLSYIADGEFDDDNIANILEQTKTAVIESDEFKGKADKTEIIPLSQKGTPGGVALADDVSALQQDIATIPKILTGRTVAVVTDANAPNSTHVDFPENFFTNRPVVIVNPLTGAPGTVVTGCNAFNPAPDGFDIILTRTTATNTSVDWIAVGN